MAATASDKLHSTQLSTQATNANTTTNNRIKSNLSAKRKAKRNDKNSDTLTTDPSLPSPSSAGAAVPSVSPTTAAAAAQHDEIDVNGSDSHKRRIDSDTINAKNRSSDDCGTGDAIAGNSSANDNDANGKIESNKVDTPPKARQRKHSNKVNKGELLAEGEIEQRQLGCIQIPIEHVELVEDDKIMADVSFALKLPTFLSFYFHFLFVIIIIKGFVSSVFLNSYFGLRSFVPKLLVIYLYAICILRMKTKNYFSPLF